jgi:hypothetical protein
MSRRTRQIVLSIIILLNAELLVIVLSAPKFLLETKPPDSIEGKAAWLADHPADWLTASALADAALDAPDGDRFGLWRAAYAHARHLAPYRRQPEVAFLRAGLFHWYELTPDDRKAVLKAAGPLMREPDFFARMNYTMLQLTRDFRWLRENAPDTDLAHATLRKLAVARGLFGEYRGLREDLRSRRLRTFNAQRTTADPSALLDLLPDRLDTGDEGLVRATLEELDRKAFDAERLNPKIDLLVDYAVDHGIQPLHGVLPMLETPSQLRDVTRARAALALDNPTLATRIEITTAANGAPEWEPYYLDRARFEARRRDASAANAYLVRASMSGLSTPVLAAGEETAKMLGNARAAADYHAQLVARAQQPRAWIGTCGKDELCTSVHVDDYVAGDTLRLTLDTIQSDEVAPYVEIYVDDRLAAEGEVGGHRVFEIREEPGLHRVEVRLVNPRTRNGVQRRVRLS